MTDLFRRERECNELSVTNFSSSFDILWHKNSTNEASVGNRRRRQIQSTGAALRFYHSLRKLFGKVYTLVFRDEKRSDISQLKILKRRRRDPAASLNASDGTTAQLYLGFIFDNYPKYENISKSLPNVTFKLETKGPQFKATDNERAQVFDPDKQEPLKIKVITLWTHV